MTSDYFLQLQDNGYFSPGNDTPKSTFSSSIRTKADIREDGNGEAATSLLVKLVLCLHGEAELWHVNEISEITRPGITTNLNFLCSELERRFQKPPSVALSKSERLRYTIIDVQARL
ncbi:hypothetical protein OnM2_085020 [Erysiphe neolycopersici]|uniref:Uncharacterized protein n=1 Tax=Erysiphe neolycopersici TaxID=212602 RepID=A0A420HEU8_9PEZI|nr:hypothetical protein OnM2_085020 [Erysiphe neolycopersici]